MKFWIGSLAATVFLLAASLSAGQDFPTFQGNNGRTGKNATPAISNPGQGFLTWFRPNATDGVSGTIVRNNTAIAPNVAFTAGWLASPGGATGIGIASFTYDQAPFGDEPSDQATGAYAVYGGATPYDGRFPAYYYANTVASTSTTDPRIGATQTFTWRMDPTQPPLNEAPGTGKNYALYVWLPIGSTGNFPTQQFPQRFNVYQINYGAGGSKTYIDVVDTYAAGPGWVRLGNGGLPTNLQFAYDGTTPITITLYNTVPRNATTGNLSDNAGTTLVYADAAMAVPQVGEMQATPTVAQLLSLTTHTVAAVNEKSVGEQNGNPITVSQGVVTSYDYATGTRRWTFRPAEQAFTFTMDDLSAGVSASAGFAQQTIGVGTALGRGTTYERAVIAMGGTEGVVYDTALPGNTSLLEDGDYQVQVYIAPSVATETHGNNVKVFVRENGVDLPFYIDEDRGPGWYTIGTGRFAHTQTTPLRVEITNDTNNAADVGKYAYADSVRFIGAFDTEVNSTPTNARVNIRQPGGAVVQQDVVIVACEDGHIYCLDAQGNGDGTTHVIWAYPSLPDATNPAWVDPNITAGIDGQVGPSGPTTIAQMPVGFGRTSPIVQTIGANDYIYVASRNGRVYCIDATGRGDYDFTAGKAGTTTRVWSYPSDFPSSRRAGSLGTFTNASIAFANVGGTNRLYVPTETGHLYALDPVGVLASHTTNVLWDYPGRTTSIQPITTTPTIDFGRVYFGTAETSIGSGRLYSLDAATGGAVQQYIPVNSGSWVGGAATATAAEIGAGGIDTVFMANSNRTVFAFDATNLGNVIWQTDELNTTVTGALAFTPMNVYDRTGALQVLPTVVVPGANGYVSALFARGGVGIDAENIFNTKLAWQYSAADLIVASLAVGGPTGFPGFMYTGDLSGNLYAWSNTGTLPGQGEPPGDEVIPPNDPRGAIFRDARIKVINKNAYDQLREDPTALTEAVVSGAGFGETPPFAFEWGETAYFVVYDFPYAEDVNGNAAVTPSLINFQISTDGATTRQFAVVARQFAAGSPANKDGYAILAFAIQGSGPNSLPPGRGRVSYTVSPGRSAANVNSAQVAQDPNQAADFHVNNPIGIKMTGTGIGDDIGVTTNRFDAGAALNGSPDVPGTPGNNESLLTSTFGMVGHNSTGTTSILVYDRSLMTLLRGPDRGLDQVRVARPELEWLGGATGVVKPIPTGVFGTSFEDVPDERPNISLDYPNIKAEQIRTTKDPNGNAENPGFSGVFLKPPLTAAGQPIDETTKDARVLQPTIFEFDVDVPRFQPANNSTNWQTSNGFVNSGYSGRVNVFVDSNLDGALDTIGGRSEAYRGFWLNGSVAIDEGIVVRTPNVDLGSLPSGAGYAPGAPGTGANTIFTPWGGPTAYTNMFKSFVVENPGNVNLLNLRMAKATFDGTTRLSWGIFSSSVDDFGWLDAGVDLWSDIDATFARTPQVILQKSRVGDRGNSVLSTNPIIRVNANLGVDTSSRFLPAPFSDDPRVAVTLPPGFPVGTYSQVMRVIEDTRTPDQSLDLSPTNTSVALESYSDPTFTLTFKVREARLTNTSTLLDVPMIDDPAVLGTGTADFMHQNLQPTAARGIGGHVVVAWTSTRATDTAVQPTSASKNDQYRIFLAGLNGNNGTPDGRSDPTNAVADLTGFVGAAGKWFQLSPSSTTGYPAPGFVYPTSAGATVVGGSERYGAPSLPGKGFVNPFVPALAGGDPTVFSSLDMAFIGDAQTQTSSGRTSTSMLFMSRMTVDNAGVPTLDATPTAMPYDTMTQKGKPSVLKLDANRSLVFYSALGTGNSNIFWTLFDYSQRGNAATNGFTVPSTLDFGDGFESLGSPSISGRQYIGAGGATPLIDLSFTGKLRGRSNTEVFIGRIAAPAGVPQSLVNFPASVNEVLTPDSEVGTFRAKGVEWDTAQPVTVVLDNGAPIPTYTDIEKPNTRRIDRETGLIVFDTLLGGKAYIDPRMGTVRLSTGLPTTTSKLELTYTAKFRRVSVSTAAGSVGVSMFVDNRFDGVKPPSSTKYWAEPNGNGIVAGDHPQTNRMFLTYNRAAAGAGQSARPLMQTLRLGIQLPFKIFTDQGGNLSSGGTPTIQFIGPKPTGFFQVDPVKGRVYFSPQDEDQPFTIQFYSVDSSSGALIGPYTVTNARVSWITESSEAPVPIEQAVNESSMFAFPDPFDSATFPRPNLVWMFWTSTRGGAPDLYFQTVAPRFAPQPGGN